jgi:anti-sigma regulatory factor (Ser/Thr protein kinase)
VTESDELLRAATQLPPVRQSPGYARRFVGDILRRWGLPNSVETAQLLTSELVTNAVVHAGTEVQIVLEAHDETLHVEVIDLTERPPVVRLTPYDDLQTGRGLAVLDSVARAWGVAPLEHGKSVWFELDTERAVVANGR